MYLTDEVGSLYKLGHGLDKGLSKVQEQSPAGATLGTW